MVCSCLISACKTSMERRDAYMRTISRQGPLEMPLHGIDVLGGSVVGGEDRWWFEAISCLRPEERDCHEVSPASSSAEK